jgi:ribonucleotide reductase beta subunit family protein with ferritin-like domain
VGARNRMSDKLNLILYLYAFGKLHRYLLRTTINETISENDEEFESKVKDIFYSKMPTFKGKSDLLDIEVFDGDVL